MYDFLYNVFDGMDVFFEHTYIDPEKWGVTDFGFVIYTNRSVAICIFNHQFKIVHEGESHSFYTGQWNNPAYAPLVKKNQVIFRSGSRRLPFISKILNIISKEC